VILISRLVRKHNNVLPFMRCRLKTIRRNGQLL